MFRILSVLLRLGLGLGLGFRDRVRVRVSALPSVRAHTFDVLICSNILLIAATRFVNLQKLL